MKIVNFNGVFSGSDSKTAVKRRKFVEKSKAILYPRCFVKRKTGSFMAPFFEELLVLSPTEADSTKIDTAHFENKYSLKVTSWIARENGKLSKELAQGIKALTEWGEQLGLGQSVSFETLYSALSSSQDSEMKSIMQALKGGKKEDRLTAALAFLSLSVEADKREDDLELELERVEERAKSISRLVEDETILPEAQESYYYVRPLNKARERMRAWARLALSENHIPGAWPVGESIAVKDLVDAAYESLSGGKAVLDVMSVYIPAEEEKLSDRDLIFRSRTIFKAILALLQNTCADQSFKEEAEFKELVLALAESLDSKRWEEVRGPRLVLSLYPGFSWQELVLVAAKIDKKEFELKEHQGKLCASFFIL